MTSLATDLLRINGYEPWPMPAKQRGRVYLLLTGPERDEERRNASDFQRSRAAILRMLPREKAKAATYAALEAMLAEQVLQGSDADPDALRKVINSRTHWCIRTVGHKRPRAYWLDLEQSPSWVQRIVGKL